jgi:hypothetical protein
MEFNDMIYVFSTKMYTISVTYIHGLKDDMNDPILRKVREYCELMDIKFDTEFYDSDNRSEDREYIERLPAIHVYANNDHETTLYPDASPIQTIQKVYDTYELKSLEYSAKKQIWNERIKYVKSIFKTQKRILEGHSNQYN